MSGRQLKGGEDNKVVFFLQKSEIAEKVEKVEKVEKEKKSDEVTD